MSVKGGDGIGVESGIPPQQLLSIVGEGLIDADKLAQELV